MSRRNNRQPIGNVLLKGVAFAIPPVGLGLSSRDRPAPVQNNPTNSVQVPQSNVTTGGAPVNTQPVGSAPPKTIGGAIANLINLPGDALRGTGGLIRDTRNDIGDIAKNVADAGGNSLENLTGGFGKFLGNSNFLLIGGGIVVLFLLVRK
jgi:hypothetical protein